MTKMMDNLQNHFLIAMPSLKDPYFERSVTLICEHNKDGAMGLVINQPIDLNIKDLLNQTEINTNLSTGIGSDPIYAGGPVSRDRGFVLHSPQDCWSSSLQLTPELMITTSKDILGAIGGESQPSDILITLGYAGWSAGQLEQELADNSWLTIPADKELLFDVAPEDRWTVATQKLGIDIWQISPDVGHA